MTSNSLKKSYQISYNFYTYWGPHYQKYCIHIHSRSIVITIRYMYKHACIHPHWCVNKWVDAVNYNSRDMLHGAHALLCACTEIIPWGGGGGGGEDYY